MEPTVLALSGSLRAESSTRRLLDAALRSLPDDYVVARPEYVRTLPLYDADSDGEHAPEPVLRARDDVRSAAGLVIATPEYNQGLPGGLKNWLDWVSRPKRSTVLIDTPIAVIGASLNARGAARTVTWLRHVLEVLGAVVVGEEVAIPHADEAVDESGHLVGHAADEVTGLLEALVKAAAPTSSSSPRRGDGSR